MMTAIDGGRSPLGLRELKPKIFDLSGTLAESQPAWAA